MELCHGGQRRRPLDRREGDALRGGMGSFEVSSSFREIIHCKVEQAQLACGGNGCKTHVNGVRNLHRFGETIASSLPVSSLHPYQPQADECFDHACRVPKSALHHKSPSQILNRQVALAKETVDCAE